MTLKVGELFAGYGGLGMGVTNVLGAEVAWVSDVDKGANKILAHRFPDVPNIGDITTVDWSQVEPVDVLTGGFPCQDVSTAGRRAGIRPGTRSGLWAHFAHAINELRPRMVVIENVRGLLSAKAHSDVEPCAFCVGDDTDGALRALGAVLGDLAGLGYDASWHGLRAADTGAPHGRFRVFVVAYPASDTGRVGHGDDAAPRNTDLAGLEGHRLAGERAGERAAGASGHQPTLLKTPTSQLAVNGGSQHPDKRRAGGHGPTLADEVEHLIGASLAIEAQRLLPTPRATDGEKGGPNQRGSSGDLMLPAAVQPDRLLPTPMVGSTSEAAHGQISGQYRDAMAEALTRWGDYAAAIARWEHVLGRPAPAPTMTSAKGNPQLSPAFVEWMMGLPAGWVTDVPGITRNEALKALGNGVVPQQAAAVLRLMLGQERAA